MIILSTQPRNTTPKELRVGALLSYHLSSNYIIMLSIGEFFQKFGLKKGEYNLLSKEEQKICAREYLKVKHEKRDTSVLDEIIEELN
jgi:hypothetical protein